ncbi:hypothetical protein OH807_01900 [Kitasatospora sp. NBC_01560]|uniref:hypothetical protein n=1 Tax=Kitasatospora sp. NBC_01560 TaxID=2975965 RepID=UPI003867936C
MDIVVVLDPDIPTNVRLLDPDHTPADPEHPVRRAHVAVTEASGACAPHTLCGLDTVGMTVAPHRFGDAEESASRPRWHTCSTCRNTTPTAAHAG